MKKILIILSIIIITITIFAIYKISHTTANENTTSSANSSANSNITTSSTPQDPSKGTIVSISDLAGKRVLIDKHFLNYAFSFEHEGIILCTDGTIYNYKYSNEDELAPTPYKKIIEESDDIISHVTTFEGRVPTKDLENLSSLLKTLSEDYTFNNVAMYKGEDTIIYYNYDDNKKITIESTGDSIVKNNSENAEKIIKILYDYHIRIDK